MHIFKNQYRKYSIVGIVTPVRLFILFISLVFLFLFIVSLSTTVLEYKRELQCQDKKGDDCDDHNYMGLKGEVKLIIWIVLLVLDVIVIVLLFGDFYRRKSFVNKKFKSLEKTLFGNEAIDNISQEIQKHKNIQQQNVIGEKPSPKYLDVEKQVAISSNEVNQLYSLQKLVDNSVEKKYILQLVKDSWVYDRRRGKDSRGLQHHTLNVKNVFKVNNTNMWMKYESSFKPSNRTFSVLKPLPKELEEFPIITTKTSGLEEYSGLIDIHRIDKREVHLFHGTKLYSLPSIVEQGFKLKKARRGLYGEGLYMAESSEKADQYSDPKTKRKDQNLVMIVVRVNLGNIYVHKDNYNFSGQNLMKGRGRSHYHTVVAGFNKRFREFLVLDTCRCYPEYLVVYERVNKEVEERVEILY